MGGRYGPDRGHRCIGGRTRRAGASVRSSPTVRFALGLFLRPEPYSQPPATQPSRRNPAVTVALLVADALSWAREEYHPRRARPTIKVQDQIFPRQRESQETPKVGARQNLASLGEPKRAATLPKSRRGSSPPPRWRSRSARDESVPPHRAGRVPRTPVCSSLPPSKTSALVLVAWVAAR